MIKEQRRKQKIWKRILTTLAVIAAACGVVFLLMMTVFIVRKTDVEGCVNSNPTEVVNAVNSNKYCRNSIYLYFKNRFDPVENVPFVDSVKVKLNSPWHVSLEVTEKSLIGYVYDESSGLYSYIDSGGRIAEQTDQEIEGLVQITGVEIGDAKAGDALPADPSTTGGYLADLYRYAQQYSLPLKELQVEEGGAVTIICDDISVKMGLNLNTEDKFIRLQLILPELDGRSGTIDLSAWSKDGDDIIFMDTSSESGSASSAEDTADETDTSQQNAADQDGSQSTDQAQSEENETGETQSVQNNGAAGAGGAVSLQ